ncbi:3-hydroxyacyl-CoA dehydrogenase NAD-binding domain-containing protein [Aliifodinibius sp. S!AR15-10]|uniref:3-hydroxyacyl-CoA dehydrogenase NAD-binding domain-containing protein n=1 Tax=Aliifodinibius sp. S!AR15-10 TaxID=2950437 RepID=UPI002866355D|nr:3-hydroxyacyl-CoA dehydrogenase NAD-binding domain-containing protein [Aliifodinibius sp. S!AR15-10]MDR8393307.1 3-hydroxyacyl-CoA dehydrogenase NAD-binding domain-containing protein [Aliifodinibius sp. S!AR15-10]
MVSELNKEDLIGVVGAGTMGTGIAQVASTYGHNVVLYDSYPDQLGESKHGLRSILQRQVEKERMTQQEVNGIMERIDFTEDLTGFGECSLIIEAVPEDLEIKQDTFRRLEGIAANDCILATNTSSLSIAAISSALKRPKRFVGLHFFNPAPLMPLAEIIPGIASSQQAVDTARELVKKWDKTTVIAKDTPGFIVNRVARPFYGEALRLLEEGIADVPTIDWAMKEMGEFKMGPFELMDLIGNDVNYKVTRTVFEEFFYDPRFKPSITQKRMVEAGFLGKKTGRGFYEYEEEANKPEPMKEKKLGEKVLNRILVMLINEAADAVFMNIASVEDVDLAMTKGVNYPKGLLKWADEIGLPKVLDQLSALQVEYREDRYRPNPLIKRKVRNGETFY